MKENKEGVECDGGCGRVFPEAEKGDHLICETCLTNLLTKHNILPPVEE